MKGLHDYSASLPCPENSGTETTSGFEGGRRTYKVAVDGKIKRKDQIENRERDKRKKFGLCGIICGP